VALLEVLDLSCGYGDRVVLRGLAFEVQPGEVTALLGPNGSGKSTLLKALMRGAKVQGGQAKIAGDELDRMDPVELARRIGFVPQEEHFSFPFTARQVVLMGRLPHSDAFFDTVRDQEVAEAAMRTADCWTFAERPVTELSGGERQRVLIARALAQEPQILLLDEPTSHLDIAHQLGLRDVLRKFAKEGKAVLIALHDLNLAAETADSAILLGDGKCALQGAVDAVLRSSELDRIYGVEFARITDESGRTRVMPRGYLLPDSDR